MKKKIIKHIDRLVYIVVILVCVYFAYQTRYVNVHIQENTIKQFEAQFDVELRTCTPIGINNKRFLAAGEFVSQVETEPSTSGITISLFEYGLIFISLISIILLIKSFFDVWRKYVKNVSALYYCISTIV